MTRSPSRLQVAPYSSMVMQVDNPNFPGMAFNAGALYRIAKAAYERITPGMMDGERNQAVLATIVFAAFSLEAFINELAYFADKTNTTEADIVKSLGATLAEAEESRVSVETKYMLASTILTGKAYKRGLPPFQDFKLLVDLRDAIAHFKAVDTLHRKGSHVEFESDKRPIIRRLKSKNVLSHMQPASTPLIGLIATKEAAQWACNTAAAMVQSLCGMFPIGELKEELDVFRNQFSSISETPGGDEGAARPNAL